MNTLTITLQILVAASVFFVWVVRYSNIVEEFKYFGLPEWLRDAVGVLKLTFALMLLTGLDRAVFAVIGGGGMAILMIAAFVTHVRVKNPFSKMAPSLVLFVSSATIVALNFPTIQR